VSLLSAKRGRCRKRTVSSELFGRVQDLGSLGKKRTLREKA
jgi:hypothetical protein